MTASTFLFIMASASSFVSTFNTDKRARGGKEEAKRKGRGGGGRGGGGGRNGRSAGAGRAWCGGGVGSDGARSKLTRRGEAGLGCWGGKRVFLGRSKIEARQGEITNGEELIEENGIVADENGVAIDENGSKIQCY